MPARIDLTGMHFEEWEVLEYVGNKKWKCRCSCGTISEVDGNSLRRGMSTSCGCKRTKENLIGRQFGTFEVIEKLPGTEWRCKCKSCGKTTTFTATELTWGKFKKCECQGDVNPFIKDDLNGRIFGDWKVLGYSGHKMWKCQCLRCGRIKDVRRNSLTMGTSTSCGCGKNQFIDLQGQVFGYLKVLEYVGDNKWKCICKCGTITYVEGKALREGRTKSCGCKFKEIRNETMLERYGELATRRIENPREDWQIGLANSKEGLLKAIQMFIDKYGRKPFASELGEFLGTIQEFGYNQVRKYKLYDYVQHPDGTSMGERQILEFILSMSPNEKVTLHAKGKTQDGYIAEIDIYFPDRKLGIEYNGSYWHCDEVKEKTYHQRKTLVCRQFGIRIIHIFDYEWLDIMKREKIKAFLVSIFNNSKQKIYAKSIQIAEVTSGIAYKFLDKYHLQGSTPSQIYLGAFYNNNIIGVMSFGVPRLNKGYQFELQRFVWNYDYTVVGGAEKLFSYFINKYKPMSIICYCDAAKFSGDVYRRIGFNLCEDPIAEPNYVWVEEHIKSYLTRYQTMKQTLIEKGLGNLGNTEDEIMKALKYYKVYDSGNYRFEWVAK